MEIQENVLYNLTICGDELNVIQSALEQYYTSDTLEIQMASTICNRIATKTASKTSTREEF